MKASLEQVYREHHAKNRGEFALINGEERSRYLQTRVGQGKRVLDIGCRDGALTRSFAAGNEVVGVDIDSAALERARATLGITVVHADLNGVWPVAGDFDVAVACEIVEHLYSPQEVMKKLYAQLRPGGLLLGSVPHAFSLQSRLRLLATRKENTPLSDPTHINHFTARELRAHLEQAGFADVELTTIVAPKFKLLAKLFPYTFAHSFLFSARKPVS